MRTGAIVKEVHHSIALFLLLDTLIQTEALGEVTPL